MVSLNSFSPVSYTHLWVTVGVLAFSILLKTWMALFNTKTGKMINSNTLIATAEDSRNAVSYTHLDVYKRQMKDISEWLGHADISTTMNIYGHISMKHKRELGQGLKGMFLSLIHI